MKLPPDFAKFLRDETRPIHLRKLEIFIRVRGWKEDNEHRIPSVMEYYAAVGRETGWSAKTIERSLLALREYDDEKLRDWFQNGITFSHLETANWATTVNGAKHFENPAALLDDAVQVGNAENKTMTVEEMQAHTLSEQIPRSKTYREVGFLSRLSEGLPIKLGWSSEKTKTFRAIVADLIAFVEAN